MPTVERGHSFCFALIAFGRATEIKYEGMFHVFSFVECNIKYFKSLYMLYPKRAKKVDAEKPLKSRYNNLYVTK